MSSRVRITGSCGSDPVQGAAKTAAVDELHPDTGARAHQAPQRRTQAEIGRHLGLSRQQVGYDLAAVRREWLRCAVADFDARRAEELARVDRLGREYWDAWEASKRERQTSTTEQTTDADGERLRAGIRKAEQTGDPRYLYGVERCIEQRAKLLGLHAPVEARLTGRDGGPLAAVVAAVEMTDDERAAAVANLLARVGAAGPGPHLAGQARPPGRSHGRW